MSVLRNIVRLQRSKLPLFSMLFRRPFYTARPMLSCAKLKAFKEKQAKMQVDDGYPVYLKGGPSDKILMHITVGLCVFGVLGSLWVFFQLATR